MLLSVRVDLEEASPEWMLPELVRPQKCCMYLLESPSVEGRSSLGWTESWLGGFPLGECSLVEFLLTEYLLDECLGECALDEGSPLCGLFGDWHFDDTEMLIALQSNIFKCARIVKVVKVMNFWV